MQVALLFTPKRLKVSSFPSSCRWRPTLLPRTFATTSAFPPSHLRIHLSYSRSTRTQFQKGSLARSYWWSSKPTTPSDGTSVSTAPSEDVGAAPSSIQEGSTFTRPSTEIGGQPEPSGSADQSLLSPGASNIQESAALSPSSTSELSSSLPTSEPPPSILSNDALLSTDVLEAVSSNLSAIVGIDYSHLYSWVWAPGLFLRTFAMFQEVPVVCTSPVACMVLAVFLFRIPLTYFQLQGQKAQAAWAPYQDEFKSLSQEYQVATSTGNNVRAMEVAQRLLRIREETKVSPFAGLWPAFGLAYVGIGSFLGMGRLVAYQKEVEALGGTGPLANPDGLLGTGWLTDLTSFDPLLWVLLSGLTWWNVRRGALDAPKYSAWMARMPMIVTPIAAGASILIRFSSAQLIVASASIGYTVAQSYALRIPRIRALVGMQGVKNQPSNMKFPGFRESWREVRKYFQDQRSGFIERRLMNQPLPPGGAMRGGNARFGAFSSPPQIGRDQLRIKEGPGAVPKLFENPYPNTPEAPLPPSGMFAAKKKAESSTSTAQPDGSNMKVPPFKLPPHLQKGKAKKPVAKKTK